MLLKRLRRLLGRPTSQAGRRYSYHRPLLLIGVGVWLCLWRPAVPGDAVASRDRIVVTVAVALAIVGLVLPPLVAWVHRVARR